MGWMPELGSTRLLAQIVGLGNATGMCLTGRFVPADEALRIGLVSQVVPPDALMDAALAKADEIATNPTQAVMMIKELLAKNPKTPTWKPLWSVNNCATTSPATCPTARRR